MPFQEELDKAERAVEIINHKLFAWRPNDRRIADPYVQAARQAIENIQATRAAYDARRQGFGSAERQIGNNITMLKDMSAELDRILREAKIIPGPVPKGRPEPVSCFSEYGDDSSVEGRGRGGVKGIVKEGKKVFQKVKKRLSFRGEGAGSSGKGRGGGQEEEEKVVHRLTLQKDFNDPNRYSRVDWTRRPGSRSSRSYREGSRGPATDRGCPSSSRGQRDAVHGSGNERDAGTKEKRGAKSAPKRRHTLDSSAPPALNIHGVHSNCPVDRYNGSKGGEPPSASPISVLNLLDGRPPKVSAVTGPSPGFPSATDNTYRRRGGSLGGYSRRPLLDPNIRPLSSSSPAPPPPLNSDTSASSSSSTKLSMISARTEALFGRHLQQSSFRSSISSSSSSGRSIRSYEGEPTVRPSVALAPVRSIERPRDSSHGLVSTQIPEVAPLVIRKKKKNVPSMATISEDPVDERYYTYSAHGSEAGDNDGDYSDTIATDEFSFSDEVFDTHAAGVLEALDRMSGPGIHFNRLRGYDGNSE